MQDGTTLSIPQAAVRLGIPYAAAYQLVLKGDLGPAHQDGGRWRLSEAAVADYLARTGLQPRAHTRPAATE
jgi:excisionase family DNA binding protein